MTITPPSHACAEDGCSEAVKTPTATYCIHHYQRHRTYPSKTCACGRSYGPISSTQMRCSRCREEAQQTTPTYSHPCAEAGCSSTVKTKRAQYCKLHSYHHRTYSSKTCACGSPYIPTSSKQERCPPCGAKRVVSREKKRSRSRYFERKKGLFCTVCGVSINDRNRIGLCGSCSAKKQKRHRPSNLAVGQRKWAISHLPRFHKRADEFGKLIIDWMMSKELTFSAAESRLGWTTDRLRQMVTSKTKTCGVSQETISHLAETLGEDHALGWDSGRWLHELTSRRRLNGTDKQAAAWASTIVITKVDTALITAMKQEIIRRDLRRKDLPSATGISTDVACRWIGIGSPSPILPGLHQAGNVACLLAGEHAGVTDIKATMRWVLEELGERDVSEAGLLILWHLSQLHQSVRWLRTVCQRDNFTIDGLIRIGIASPATCERVAHALKLDSLAQADLYAKVNTPKRDEKKRQKTLKRNRHLRRIAPVGARQAAQVRMLAAQERMLVACRRIEEEGKVPSQTMLNEEFGFSRPATRAFLADYPKWTKS